MLKKVSFWMRVIYGGLMVAAAMAAVMVSGHVAYPNALMLFGGAMILVSIRRQWMYNAWILTVGLVMVQAGALCSGLLGELHLSHQLIRLLISGAILAVHLKELKMI